MRRALTITALLCSCLMLVQVAFASPPRHRNARRAARVPQSRSIGAPWHGHLENGIELRESESVRRAGAYRSSTNFFGTVELVHLIERAAAVVTRRHPGSRLSTGELSRRNGGEIDGHGSHENGRDADLAFYMMDSTGHPYAAPYAFAEFGADGHGRGANQSLRFDDARNWDLVSRLVADGEARVQFIFVAHGLRDRVLAEGRARHAPASVLARAASVLVQPAQGNPHRNHFHVRIYCDPSDRPACVDRAPFHAWYPGVLPQI